MARRQQEPLMEVGQLVTVDWVDSCGPVGKPWYFAEELEDMDVSGAKSVGWVHAINDRFVTLVSSFSTDGNFGGIIAIPIVAITGIAHHL